MIKWADTKHGATYRTGRAVEDISVPESVLIIDRVSKEKKSGTCELHGCHGDTHKTRKSCKCTYYKCLSRSELITAMSAELRQLYPDEFGE